MWLLQESQTNQKQPQYDYNETHRRVPHCPRTEFFIFLSESAS